MIRDINEKINRIKEELASKKILESKFQKYKLKLQDEEKQLIKFEANLKKEHKDVERLEKLSIFNLVATLMKNKEEKLQKEEYEYVMAKIKYDEQSTKVALTRENIQNLKDRLDTLSNCDNEYKQLLAKKVELIKNLGDSYNKEKLERLEFEIDKALSDKKEIEEAIAIGKKLLTEIKNAEKSLDSAKNWGTWDMFGGDMISSIAKHNKINDAERSFSRIASLIASFNNELLDVRCEGITFSNTTIAFDIFFDNIFTDWAVQNKINDAINKVVILKRRVKEILYGLDKQNETLKTVIENKRREYEILIENI